MIHCIAIFGPTASGKSSLALELAKEYNGDIISCDSMQIYRGMNIGTAKPTRQEQMLVPHKMIDICDPDDSFSVFDYKKLAEEAIQDTIDQNKIPFIVGGTGLYFDALFFNQDFGDFNVSEEIHNELSNKAEHSDGTLLLQELAKIDPESAQKLHPKDKKRIVRALEVYYSTGKTLTHFRHESRKKKGKFEYTKIFLNFHDRDILYNRINQRVDQMIAAGLVDETGALYQSGAFLGKTANQAIGYKEILPHLLGHASLDECVDVLKQKSRNYAKRQITWFRRYHDANTVFMDDEDPINVARKIIDRQIVGE